MENAADTKALALPHRLVLEGRGVLSVTGVAEVESFDEDSVVLRTARGTLVVRGRQLHLRMLSPDGGQVGVDGTVDSMTYEDEPAGGGGFLSRLFG